MEPNLQKDCSLTHSLAVVRGTGNTEKEKPNFLCLRQPKISSFTHSAIIPLVFYRQKKNSVVSVSLAERVRDNYFVMNKYPFRVNFKPPLGGLGGVVVD